MAEFDIDSALAPAYRLEQRVKRVDRWGRKAWHWQPVKDERGKVMHFPDYRVEAALSEIYNDQCDAASEVCDLPLPNVDNFRLVPVEKGEVNKYA